MFPTGMVQLNDKQWEAIVRMCLSDFAWGGYKFYSIGTDTIEMVSTKDSLSGGGYTLQKYSRVHLEVLTKLRIIYGKYLDSVSI